MSITRRAAAAALSLLVPAYSYAAPFYREVFPRCVHATGVEAASSAVWKALRAGSPLGRPSLLKVFAPGSPFTAGSLGVASNPVGDSEGQAFWSRPVTGGLVVFTDEVRFPASALRTVTYEQRLDGTGDASRVALFVGGTWYLADYADPQDKPRVWERVGPLDVTKLTYGTDRPVPGTGPSAPTNRGLPYPATGTVEAVGVFFSGVTARVRLDTFVLDDGGTVPYPEQPPSAAGCPAAPASPTPAAGPPSGNVPPVRADGEVPPPEGPVPAPSQFPADSPLEENAPGLYTFCPPPGRSAVYRTTADRRARILKAMKGRGPRAARDKAVVAAALGVNVPLARLVNLTPSDLYAVGRSRFLGGPEGTRPARLPAAAARDLAAFVRRSGASAEPEGPLFRTIARGGPTRSALCLPEMTRIVRRWSGVR